MLISSGTRLGPYEIVSALGAGGMGEVYRARDTRLDRTVAIKVLPAALAADPQFRERFGREARLISALDHPNIAAVYDVGHEHGLDFIVMAFVEGETLAARLERGPLKLEDVLRYAIEIGSALDQAHRAGIVHRDVKPGNVMVTATGTKLLDFGLAKFAPPATAGGLTALPTTPPELTAAGTILGTFHYMAPEQVEGGDVDARTDIFAFGALLYEIAAGRKAFEGKSRAGVMTAILRDDPPPIAATREHPGGASTGSSASGQASTAAPAGDLVIGLDRVVRRCLAKNPDDRWQTVSDLLETLRWVRDGGGGRELVATAPRAQSRIREAIAWTLAATLALALISLAAWVWMKAPVLQPSAVRLSIAAPRETVLGAGVAFAPNGSTVVFPVTQEGATQLYRRRIDQLEAVPIRGTEGAEFPFISPDGKWVGFYSMNALKKVPIEGGPPSTIVRTERFRRGATWGPNDTIVFATDSSPDLMSVPAAGGSPSVLVPAKLFAGAALRWPSWRRDGSEVVFTIWTTGLEAARVGAYSLRSGQGATIVEGTHPMRLPTGELLYGRGGSLWTVPIDWNKLIATSAPTAVLDGLQPNIGGAVFVAASDDGSLAYVAGGSGGSNRAIAWMTRDGQREPLLDKPLTYLNQRVSPDGRRVAVQIASTDTEDDVRLYDISTRVLSRLTSGGGRHLNPVWTPDGRRIVYAHGRTSEEARSLYWMAADGTGGEERLTTTPRNQTPFDVSPDGRTLIFSQIKEDGRTALWTMPLVGDRTPRVYLQTAFEDTRARFSPDGRWVAYQSNETGPSEVYVRPFPGPGGKWQISTGGGVSPVWSPTGKELYFLRTGLMMAVDVQSGTTFGHGVPRQLFAYTAPRGPFIFSEHSMAPDGRRFLLLMSADTETAPEVLVAVNWIDELKRRAAAAR